MAKKGKSVFFKIIVITGVLLILAGIFTAYKAYTILYKSNVKLDDKNSTYLYIKTGSDFNEVLNQLNTNKIISDASSFEWLADYKD